MAKRFWFWFAAGAWLAAMAWTATAAQTDAGQISQADMRALNLMQSMMDIPTIADKHPDVLYRNVGVKAYKDGAKEEALRDFIKSASYADKLSQELVATMYWNGEGTPVDRPRAYAWMDLAADRGYRDMLVQRERYWSQLSEAERKQALDVGREVYATYSDDRGLERLQLKLSAVATQAIGSHAGFTGNGSTLLKSQSPNGNRPLGDAEHSMQDVLNGSRGTVVDDSKRYSAELWNAKQYQRLKDMQWNLATGHVEVGDLQPVHGSVDGASSAH